MGHLTLVRGERLGGRGGPGSEGGLSEGAASAPPCDSAAPSAFFGRPFSGPSGAFVSRAVTAAVCGRRHDLRRRVVATGLASAAAACGASVARKAPSVSPGGETRRIGTSSRMGTKARFCRDVKPVPCVVLEGATSSSSSISTFTVTAGRPAAYPRPSGSKVRAGSFTEPALFRTGLRPVSPWESRGGAAGTLCPTVGLPSCLRREQARLRARGSFSRGAA
jgi:hypothetical protein